MAEAEDWVERAKAESSKPWTNNTQSSTRSWKAESPKQDGPDPTSTSIRTT